MTLVKPEFCHLQKVVLEIYDNYVIYQGYRFSPRSFNLSVNPYYLLWPFASPGTIVQSLQGTSI